MDLRSQYFSRRSFARLTICARAGLRHGISNATGERISGVCDGESSVSQCRVTSRWIEVDCIINHKG